MPASQANTILEIRGVSVSVPAVRVAPTDDFLPFIPSILAVASAKSSSDCLENRKIADAITQDTVAAPNTPRITPT